MAEPIYCTNCGKQLDPTEAVMLELSWNTNRFTDPAITKIPEDESQGGWYFGKDCAKAMLAGKPCKYHNPIKKQPEIAQ